jgi:hypothetical protein
LPIDIFLPIKKKKKNISYKKKCYLHIQPLEGARMLMHN